MCGNGLDMRQRSREQLLAAAAAQWQHYTERADPASRALAEDEGLLRALLGTVRRLEQRIATLEREQRR